MEEVEVIISGGGSVGLSLAAELGWRNGIPQLRLNPRKTKFEIIDKEDSN